MDNSKDEVQGQQGAGRQKLSRRLLGKIGATGLMTSIGVFAGTATAKPAHAAPLCCDLANYPANVSYTWCRNHADYIWYCSENAYLHCDCCEAGSSWQYSAAYCRYN